MKGKVTNSANELCLELKYCERCGGLWLRPAGGGQIYCTACACKMAELPPASTVRKSAKLSQGPRWGMDHSDYEDCDDDEGMDSPATGGVA